MCEFRNHAGLQCKSEKDRHPVHHGFDFAVSPPEPWEEPNLDWVEKPPTPDDAAMKSKLKEMSKSVRDHRRELETTQRRAVGVSSVTHLNHAERAEGAEQASQAMEPDFIEAALAGGMEIMGRQERMTSDDLWDWLDDHGHYTEHPKGMRGILTKLIKEKVMEPVPDEEEDHHRPSNRTNQSRLLRVYRSLVRQPSEPVLRDFG